MASVRENDNLLDLDQTLSRHPNVELFVKGDELAQ
jgi:hypothetical protein